MPEGLSSAMHERYCSLFLSQSLREERLSVAIITVIAVVGFATTWSLFAPGAMSHDSVVQLLQARTLKVNDYHPPLMALLWALTDKVVPGPSGMLLVTNLLYWVGLAAIFGFWSGPL